MQTPVVVGSGDCDQRLNLASQEETLELDARASRLTIPPCQSVIDPLGLQSESPDPVLHRLLSRLGEPHSSIPPVA